MTMLAKVLFGLLFVASPALAADGLITIPSNFGAKITIDRLETALKSGGATIFARIDHAAGAADAKLDLRPTELLIFGNPKGGTPLMQSQQTIGIDLPLKALAWDDAAGKTWLSYNDPVWLASRHAVGADAAKGADGLAMALTNATAKATTAP